MPTPKELERLGQELLDEPSANVNHAATLLAALNAQGDQEQVLVAIQALKLFFQDSCAKGDLPAKRQKVPRMRPPPPPRLSGVTSLRLSFGNKRSCATTGYRQWRRRAVSGREAVFGMARSAVRTLPPKPFRSAPAHASGDSTGVRWPLFCWPEVH